MAGTSRLDDLVLGAGISTVGMANMKQEIKLLFLEVIGENETHWTDHWNEEHNVPTDTMNARNALRAELRQLVEAL